MKGKIMAVAAVLVMVFAAVGVVMPQTGESNADTTTADLGYIILPVTSGQTGTKTINTTEGEFTGYAYTMTISASTDSTNWTTLDTITATANNSAVSESTGSTTFPASESNLGFTLTVKKNSTPSVGSYTLTATTTGEDVTPTTVTIKAVIDPTVANETNKATQTITYTVKVMDVNDSYASTMTLTAISGIKGGEYFSSLIEGTISSTAFTASDYNWYAYGLPTGLSMSDTGYISGIYTGTTTTAVTAKVVAVHKTSGTYYAGDLTCNISAAYSASELTLTVKEGDNEITDGKYVVKTTSSTDNVTLTLSAKLGESELNSGVNYSVIAVDSDGAVKDLNTTSTNTTVEVPLTGSGAYRIVVTATYTSSNITYEDTVSFYLYVMPVFENLSAHIAVTTS